MPVRMAPERFEELVSDALDRIPPELAAAADNVVVLVEDRHPEDPELLGLYEGVNILDKVSGVEVLTKRYFNEIAVLLKTPAQEVVDKLAAKGVIGGVAMSRLNPKAGMDNVLITCATEMNTDEDIAAYAKALAEVLK